MPEPSLPDPANAEPLPVTRTMPPSTGTGPADATREFPPTATVHQTVRPVVSAPDLPAITGFVVTEELARGGMGRVLLAHDLTLGREVAIKTLLPGCSPEPATARFVRESRITAKLPHPGVPPVYQLGTTTDGLPFLAMKWVRGRTLADALGNRPAPDHDLPRFVQTFEQVCQAVGFAHARGVVHRDLKPSNIMVGEFGEVQVMDWGLAKEVAAAPEDADTPAAPEPHAGADETLAGTVLGTPAYMAPEQARGLPADRRSDVFALGAVLCDLLTGAPPFGGASTAEVLKRAAAGAVGDGFARLDRCGAAPELVALCKRCLAPDPADRPADAEAAARAVADHRAGVESRLRRAESRRAAAEAGAVEQRKRRRVQLALAAAVLVAGALAAAGGWVLDRQAAARRGAGARNAEAVGALLDRCAAALRADDAAGAGDALAEAERRLNEGGAERFAVRAERYRTELALLRELDRADDLRWSVVDGDFRAQERGIAAWPGAFARWGIVIGQTPPAEAAERINGSPVRDRVLAALDLWLLFGKPADGLLEVLRAADPDPFRDAVRAALRAGDSAAVRALADRPEATAQPARFAAVLGDVGALDMARRRAILGAAHLVRPGDLPILMSLGDLGDPVVPAAERAGWFRAAVAARPTNAAAWTNLGVALLDANDPDGASAAAREAIRLDPKLARAHNNLGVALQDKKDLDAAEAALREALRLEPDFALAHANVGSVRLDRDDPDGAITAAREAIRLDPTLARAHNVLGLGLREKGELVGAEAAFREALRLDPKFAPAHANLAWVRLDRDDPDGAITAAREAIRLDPTLARAHNRLGLALQRKGEPEAAEAEYRTAIRLDPKFAPAHSNLGSVRLDRNDPDGAVAAAREAIRLDPKWHYAHNVLGVGLRDKGDLTGAEAALREAVRIKPDFALAHANLGVLRVRRNDPDGAVAAVREAIRLDPKYAFAHQVLGDALAGQKNYAGAEREYREVVRLAPRNATAHHNLGLMRYQQGDPAGAARAYRAALAVNPGDAATHANLGHALLGAKDLDGALDAWGEAARLAPKDPKTHLLIGLVRFDRDGPGLAEGHLREAVRLDPTLVFARDFLGRCLGARGDWAGAVREFRAVLRLAPEHPGGAELLADALRHEAGVVAPPPRAVRP